MSERLTQWRRWLFGVAALAAVATLVAVLGAFMLLAAAGLCAMYAGLRYERAHGGRAADAALTHSNSRLALRVAELEARWCMMSLLGSMSEQLQTAASFRDAYALVTQFAERMFPRYSGALCAVEPVTSVVRVVGTWGHPPHRPGAVWCDCRALYSEQAKVVPFASQGRALGLLCFHWQSAVAGTGGPTSADFARNGLAVAFAEHVGLALSSLDLKQELLAQALHDPLTGLHNRRFLDEEFHRDLQRAARTRKPVGILMLDLDDFKAVNDVHGHAAGDALLRAFAAQLRNEVRAADIACRYGGEEFALILSDATVEQSFARAEIIREGVHHLKVDVCGVLLACPTVSIGVAGWPRNGSDPDTLLRAADAALYVAKANGRDRTEVALDGKTLSVDGDGRAMPIRAAR